jgi:rubredoxin
MDKWRCSVCNYVYDPKIGDPESGIEPGMPFEKLPDRWGCPECGASKDMFRRIEDAAYF